MTERPILFSAPMVRALLDGRKTQTRRVMKIQPPKNEDFPGSYFGVGRKVADGVKWFSLNEYPSLPKHPTKWDLDGSVGVARTAGFPMEYDARFAVGDRLWVKETWRTSVAYDDVKPSDLGGEEPVKYEADGEEQMWGYSHLFGPGKKRVSIFMPRWASRLTLIVTDVRVERLHDISEADAQAEGAAKLVMDDSGTFYDGFPEGTYRCGFAGIWSHINGAASWEANPWVIAVTFDVKEGNIDG